MASNIAATVKKLVAPTAEALGYILWDVEYLREGAQNILRITIDKEGGIFIEDCEKMHRAVDPLLDEADPISDAYNLEVSSPGLSRQIKNAEQAEMCIGKPVCAKFYAPEADGKKTLDGTLDAYADGTVTIGGTVVDLKKIARLTLDDE